MRKMMKMKSRSHRYDINRPRPTNGSKYTKYKICLSIMMVLCIKEHTNSHQFMKKLNNIEAELKKKRVAYKEKACRCPFADLLQKNCP